MAQVPAGTNHKLKHCRRQGQWARYSWVKAAGVASAMLVMSFASACHGEPGTPPPNGLGFTLTTSAFRSGDAIPVKFTCQGQNSSPALRWTEPPAGTKSFALIVDDPDAPGGTWVHWVVFDLPATARQLPEAVAKVAEIQAGGKQGSNDFPEVGYGGPCPPSGKPHRYFFKIYALNTLLGLRPGATKRDVERAMQGHILAQAQLVGLFGR